MLNEVDSSKILETAMRLVSSATSSIQMTMQADEEKRSPLPEEYFTLLQERLDSGIKVIRIGFGSEKDFESLSSRIRVHSPNYRFGITPSTEYRRMLLVDSSKLLFAKTDETGRKVYYTEDPEVVSEYAGYFQSLLATT